MQQAIEVFNSEDVPLSLVLLIDDDLKDDNAQQVVASLHSILAGISSVDEPAVWAFDLKFHPSGELANPSMQCSIIIAKSYFNAWAIPASAKGAMIS